MPLANLRDRMMRAPAPTPAPAPVVVEVGQAEPGLLRQSAELVALFAALLAFDRWVLPGAISGTLSPNPLWFPVLVMTVGYGAGMGLSAALLASAIWAFTAHPAGPGDHLAQILRLSLDPMEWIVAALVIGELTSNRLERLRRARRRAARRDGELNQLATTLDQLGKINRALQVRIATEERTVGQAIGAALDLVDEDAEHQTRGIEHLIGLAVQTGDFAFYATDGRRLTARFRGPRSDHRPDELPAAELARQVIAGSGSRTDGGAPAVITDGTGTITIPVVSSGDTVTGALLFNAPVGAHLPVAKLAELSEVARVLGRIAGHGAPAAMAQARKAWHLSEDAA